MNQPEFYCSRRSGAQSSLSNLLTPPNADVSIFNNSYDLRLVLGSEEQQ
jgi:hypothetical protein